MEANIKRYIQSGAEFNHLFPKPQGEEIEIKKNADVSETIAFIHFIFDTINSALNGINLFLEHF